MSKESEFGRGLVVCLAKFYQHFSNDSIARIKSFVNFSKRPENEQEKIISDNPPPSLQYGSINQEFKWWLTQTVPIYGSKEDAISSNIVTWANGASDHLYEIKAPKGKEWKEMRKIVKELQEKGLDMGHGNGLMGKAKYTYDDIISLQNLTEKALLLVDEILGLKPDWGTW